MFGRKARRIKQLENQVARLYSEIYSQSEKIQELIDERIADNERYAKRLTILTQSLASETRPIMKESEYKPPEAY